MQAFGASGSAAGSATLALNANQTAMFGTIQPNGLAIDANLSSPGIAKGYAQVLSTSKALICSAILAEVNGNTPATVSALPVLKGTKQKGN